MRVVVQKYGGSSVADTQRLRKVAERVVRTREQGYDVVVVVSAMGNTTNELLKKAHEMSAAPPTRELDMLLSVGERISMALLSMAIQSLGHESISFTGSQVGIITTASHAKARIVEVRPFRILDELEQGRIVIVAGYQGTSYKREITTLGRGGSDTTAIALAAALDAEYCEICSDVDGVFSADPRVVPDAVRIDEMTHDEMLEMARAGAKVLNAQAVEYARRNGIAIYARSTTGGPEARGTIVRTNVPQPPRPVTAIAGRTDLLLLRIEGDDQADLHQRYRSVLGLLEQMEIAADRTFFSADDRCAATLVFSTENLHGQDAFRRRLANVVGKGAALMDGVGSATVVGPDLTSYPDLPARALNALGEVAAEVLAFDFGPSALTFVLPSESTGDAVRRLHGALIE
jgi:aspartate kinase